MPSPLATESAGPPSAPHPERPLAFDWWRPREAERLERKAARLRPLLQRLQSTKRIAGQAVGLGCVLGLIVFPLLFFGLVNIQYAPFPVNLLLGLSILAGVAGLFIGVPAYNLSEWLCARMERTVQDAETTAQQLRDEHAALQDRQGVQQ